jgi:1,4-alpha-glucan branching enzyme
MSGMPGLALPLEEGGMGFDFRMSMGVPDYWIKLIKEKKDEDWHVGELFYELTNKRFEEHTISYAESHDQAMVGDQTLFFRLVGREIYTGMHLFGANLIIERGMALHKMIRLITITTAGDGYLNFMGNEFGHPEWIDFPREGNQWSYQYARRQWSLADDLNLRFRFLQAFDKAMICLARQKEFFSAIPEPIVRDNESQILIFKRGVNLFVFNFSPEHSYVDYRLQVDAGKYMLVLHTDEKRFDGLQRLEEHQEYMTLHQRGGYILSLYIPSRTALVLEKK